MNEQLKPITHICFNITDDCNLKCTYCFNHQQPHYTSLEIAKDVMCWLQKNAKLYQEQTGEMKIPSVGFFGGEPTLLWDQIIVPIVEWNKTQKYEFSYGITTNGTLLNKNRIKYLKDNKINILLSMDGAQVTQDINRPCRNGQSSYELVSKNIPCLLENFPNTMFRSTISPATADRTFENIAFAGDRGFTRVFSIINVFEEWNMEARQALKNELRKYSLYFINCCRKEKPFIIFDNLESIFLSIIKNYNKQKEPMCLGCPGCGLGDGYGSVNYKGDIFTCQEVASYGTENNIFYLGSIYDGINIQRVKNLQNIFHNQLNNQTPLSLEKYPNSIKWFNKESYCPVDNYLTNNNFTQFPDSLCWWYEMLVDEAYFIFNVLFYHQNQFFKNYLNKITGGSNDE